LGTENEHKKDGAEHLKTNVEGPHAVRKEQTIDRRQTREKILVT
jgi:hypothetical protein